MTNPNDNLDCSDVEAAIDYQREQEMIEQKKRDVEVDYKKLSDEYEWDELHMCTVIGVQDGYWFELTDKHPEWKQVGNVFRIFSKDDIPNFICYPGKREAILKKIDPDRKMWNYGHSLLDYDAWKHEHNWD